MPRGILTLTSYHSTWRRPGPQTLLATHFNGQPLTVDHGAPLRLLVPVKLGLKNVKAITRITNFAEEPRDYWAKRGYSRYDGI
jgi:DMSO/TMAO reductase YedYZ molybdopterin-dependent catalytic subunit